MHRANRLYHNRQPYRELRVHRQYVVNNEVLIHPAMISHTSPVNILILGEYRGALREVLKIQICGKCTCISWS